MLGEACAITAALTWSASVVLFKRSESVSPQGMNLFKNVAATLLLIATLPALGVGLDPTRSGSDWGRLVVSGVLGIAVADTLVFTALRRLGAGTLAVVDCVYAPVNVLLGVFMLGEEIGPIFLVGAALVVGGVLVASLKGRRQSGEVPPPSGTALTRSEIYSGAAIGVVGIVAMAVGVMLAKPVLERSNLVEVTLIRLVAGIGGQLVWIALRPSQRGALQALKPSRVWRTLMPAALLGSYVSMLLWLGGFKWTEASRASVLNQMSTVFTLVLARVFLGEQLTWRRALGAGAALCGAVLVLM